jgi:hypothetical protein
MIRAAEGLYVSCSVSRFPALSTSYALLTVTSLQNLFAQVLQGSYVLDIKESFRKCLNPHRVINVISYYGFRITGRLQ